MRIRTLALALAAVALAAPRADAQIVPSIDLGVAGGVNFASLGDAGSLDLDNSTGYHIGLYADVGVLFASARTGVYYVSAGDLDSAADDNSISYVSVPIDFQIKTPTPLVQAYALVGPEFRFAVDGLDTFDTESQSTAVNIGLGVRGGVPLIGPSGFLELRYGLDLTGIRDTDGDDDVKVNLVMIRVGAGI